VDGVSAVRWTAPVFAASGYGDEARQFALGLDALGVPVQIAPLPTAGLERAELPHDELARLHALAAAPSPADAPLISVVHAFAPHFHRVPGAAYHVGRTMFETDRLPASWVAACAQMDELWVPSAFNVESFARAGVGREKLVAIPGAIDLARFRPGVAPLPLAGRRGFTFLSVFDWSWRKGWDVLLRAFAAAFGPRDDVCLVLKVWSSGGRTLADLRHQAEQVLRDAGIAAEFPANVLFYEANLRSDELPRLYAAADAFVLPTRGEGWGRPLMEAMAMGLPTIGTRGGGHLAFMNDANSYLIDCALVDVPKHAWHETPAFVGHRWAEPSVEHLRALLRQVAGDPTAAQAKGQAARAHITTHFGRERVAQVIAARLAAIAAGLGARPVPSSVAATGHTPPRGAEASASFSGAAHLSCQRAPAKAEAQESRLHIVWEGGQFVHHSLALVNRELCLGLLAAGHELSLLPTGEEQFGAEADARLAALAARIRAPLSRPPDFHVRHTWPPDFVPPPAGRWLMIQPWEYGVVPRDWVEPIAEMVDEVWVPSSYVRQAFIAGGVPAERVAVVPNGVNLDRFRPDAPPRALPTARRCKLLFVGGTVLWRKGVDVLLKAYRAAFTCQDDVCLVLKDLGRGRLYSGDISGLLEPFWRDRTAPELLYLTDELPEADLPGLYVACDALVQPFRGEGYGLPVAEALACGRPVVVTRGGPCDEFCPDTATYWIPATRVPCELPMETAQPAWVLEPDVAALAAHLRAIYERPDEARARGAAGAAIARRYLGWEHAVRIAQARLAELRARPPRRAGVLMAAGDGASAVTKAEAGRALQLARAYARTGATLAAARMLTRALDLDPDLAEAHDLLAQVELQRERPAAAVAAARRAVALAPTAAAYYGTLGAALAASGERAGAVAAYQQALALDHHRADLWRAVAALHAAEGRMTEARAAEERATALDGGAAASATAIAQAIAALERGREHTAAGRWDAAAEALNQALNFDPLLATAHYLLGYVEMQRGALDAALRALRQAVELAPESADCHSALGVALYHSGDLHGAEASLRRALAYDETRGDVWGNLAELYEAQARWADAAAAYERAQALGDERGAAGARRARARMAHA
jgi:glycosyltransferase involved in cell wall biosynthesis/Tfp pilus assembly protein PilF